MELVEGSTLADRLPGGPLPLADALRIARDIADALEAAHERGIVHRDLKPANGKASVDGATKVLDFGLATAAQPDVDSGANPNESPTLALTIGATQAGVLLGTAAYMSPEQASARRVDKRSDIWSFGVVVWEMLAGARLFQARRSRTRWPTCCAPTSTSPACQPGRCVSWCGGAWNATSASACETLARHESRSKDGWLIRHG